MAPAVPAVSTGHHYAELALFFSRAAWDGLLADALHKAVPAQSHRETLLRLVRTGRDIEALESVCGA